MIELEYLRVEYQGGHKEKVLAIEDISLKIADCESIALIGPSGCGKTSLLYVLCGLIKPSAGSAKIDSVPVSKPSRNVALILQDIGLLPWKTVFKNASLSLELNGERDRQKVYALLDELGLQGFYQRYPAQLSGGEKQRVAIARALATNPKILLMDEPLVSLDTFTREHIQDLILELWQKRKHTQIIVTHDIEEAVFLGQRIVVLSPRPAKIQTILENPGMGQLSFRESAEFYEQVLALRGLIPIIQAS